MLRACTLIATLPLLAACYRYSRIDTSELTPGMSVRTRISGAAADQIQPLLGTSDARILTGKLIVPGPDTLIIEVPSVLRADVGSGGVQTLSQRVSIPRSAIFEMESRTIDRFRTYAVAGGTALVIGGFILKATVLDPGAEKGPGGQVPPELRRGVVGFRLNF